MARRNEKRTEMWEIFRTVESPPPVLSQPVKSSFLPSIKSRENLKIEDTPRAVPRPEELNNDLRSRVRDLEIQLLDFRSSFERRLVSITEDYPARIHEEIKVARDRELFNLKETNQKQQHMAENLRAVQEGFKNSLDAVNYELSTLRRRVDEGFMRSVANVRDVDLVARSPRLTVESPPQSDLNPLLQRFHEAISEERHHRELAAQEHNHQIQELHMLIKNSQLENARKLQEYQSHAWVANCEAKGQMLEIQQEKVYMQRGEQEYIRGIFESIKSRLEAEINHRTQMEAENKLWTDSRLNAFQKMLKSEEKGLAEREAKILNMMQEGLSALNEIIHKTKEAEDNSVGKLQEMMAENFQEFGKAIITVRDGLNGRMERNELMLQAEANYRAEQGKSVEKYLQQIAEDFEQQKIYLENQIMSSENRQKAIIYEIQQDLTVKEEAINRWKLMINEHLVTEFDKFKLKLYRLSQELEDKLSNSRLRTPLKMEDENLSEIEPKADALVVDEKIIDQKLDFALSIAKEKFDKEIEALTELVEKTAANITADTAKNLEFGMEQMQKLWQEQIKHSIEEIKFSIPKYKSTIPEDSDPELNKRSTSNIEQVIAELSARIESTDNEAAFLKNEIDQIKKENQTSIQGIFLAIAEATGKLQLSSEIYSKQLVEATKNELSEIVESGKHLSLKELERLRKEFEDYKMETDDLAKPKVLNTNNEYLQNESKRYKDIMKDDKRIEDALLFMQEAINQSAEAIKAVTRALISKETAERAKSEEDILTKVNLKISELENIINEQFMKLKNDPEMKSSPLALITHEAKGNSLETRIQAIETNLETQTRVIIDTILNSKNFEDMIRKQVKGFLISLESPNSSHEIVQAFLDNLINIIEKNEWHEVIKEVQHNIEILFRNMQSLEDLISSTKEEIYKDLADMNNKHKQVVEENIDSELVQKNNQKNDILVITDQISLIKQDLLNIQEAISELKARQAELNAKQSELVFNKTTQNEQFKDSLMELLTKHEELDNKIKIHSKHNALPSIKSRTPNRMLSPPAKANDKLEYALESIRKKQQELADQYNELLKQKMTQVYP